MYLFTTPSAPTVAPAPTVPVVDAIRRGAQATGTDFDYLLRTAKRESALDPTAKASTSSATGLFQFIEQTWLGVVKSGGDRLGLAEQARAVTARPDGSLIVADPEARQSILKLREDPQVASAMAGVLTRQNRDALIQATGREPSAGELYMAHVLGAGGARELISGAQARPDQAAAVDFPEAARANRGIFYDRGGRPRGLGEVYGILASAQSGAPPAVPTGGDKIAATKVPDAPVQSAQPPGLQGLFQTGIRSGPLSEAVARIWRTNAEGRARGPAVAFFPRSEPGSAPETSAASEPAAPAVAPEPTPAVPAIVDVPLPPLRPLFAPASAPNAPDRTRTGQGPARASLTGSVPRERRS